MRFEIRCKAINRTLLGVSAPCGYVWQTSGERGAVLCVQDHRRANPEHDVDVRRLKRKRKDGDA